VSGCSCDQHRRELLQALASPGLTRRGLLRGAVGVGAVAALAGALPSWAGSRDVTGRTWLAGDLHCHTVFSHDVWGGPDDDNTGTDEFYTWGWTPGQQIAIATARGLDFLALTDHNRTDALFGDDYTSSAVTLIPGYEHSLAGGHAGVFVPHRDVLHTLLTDTDGSTNFVGADGLQRFFAAAAERGAMVVLNHPFYKRSGPAAPPTWTYPVDASLGVDAVEVWNSVWFNRSEISNQVSYDDPAALPWWESQFLPQVRKPMVGGSDNHWRTLTGIAGVGQPTTWVQADGRAPDQVLAAIRAGRTTVSSQPPTMQGARLDPIVVEDWPGGGTVGVGDVVGALGQLLVRTTVNNGLGATLRLISGGQVIATTDVTAPSQVVEQQVVLPQHGWLRLELEAQRPGVGMLALTSPVYSGGQPAPKAARREPSTGIPVDYSFP
jgi:predicted metal-dependent phosphoesterase TrpH